MNFTRCLIPLMCFICASASLTAQQDKLTLDDIFLKGTFRSAGFGPARWNEKGEGYITLERSATLLGSDLVTYDPSTGERKILVPASELIPDGERTPLRINNYSWSADGKSMLIFTNTQRVWRYNTRGDYWVFRLDDRKLVKIGKTLPASSLMFAKFSPDAKKVAYVSRQNIYVEDIASGIVTQLTEDGGGDIINGTFDWVYEEELDCRDGFRWSPDGKKIAYWQINTKGTGVFYMINNLDSVYPEIIPVPYPKVGTKNPVAKVGVISSEGGSTTWMKLEGDPASYYIPRMDFAASSDEVMLQQLNRLQNTNLVLLGSVNTGDTRKIIAEKDSAWVDVNDDMEWLDKGKYFTWNSERGGWRQIFRISRDGRETLCLTPGKYDVISIQKIDIKNGYLYFIASPDNPTERYLFRTKMDGKGKLEMITPKNLTGQHGYQVSPDSKWAIHTWSDAVTPVTTDLVSLPAHKQVRILQNNEDLKKKYASSGFNRKEFFTVEIGEGTVLYGWMIKPAGFDPSKKYPVIFNIYGEPAGSTVQNNFGGGDLWHQYLAGQGYLIMSVDNRGTAMPRGREWRKCIYRKIGIVAPEDHAKAVRKIIESYSFVDPGRIGIWGWSGGGSMTLNCMFRHPELYKTGIAVAFVANQKFYDSVYQERYMGLPDDNTEGYRDGSPVNHAAKLQGNLLLIHGSGDDNVHYQNCEVLVNELIKQNKMFSMLEYPMRSHGIYERDNTTLHLYESMLKFWLANLPAGGK